MLPILMLRYAQIRPTNCYVKKALRIFWDTLNAHVHRTGIRGSWLLEEYIYVYADI